MSLERRIPGWSSALLAMAVAMVVWAGWREVRILSLDTAREGLFHFAGEIVRASSLGAGLEVLDDVAGSPEVRAFLSDPVGPEAGQARRRLAELAEDGSTQVGLALVGPEGRFLLADSSVGWMGSRPTDALRIDSARVAPIEADVDGAVHYHLIVPVRVEDTLVGAVVEKRRLVSGRAAVERAESLVGPGTRILFINAEGDVWTDGVGVVEAPAPPLSDTAGIVEYVRDGRASMARIEPIPGTPFRVVVERSRKAVLAPSRAFLSRSALIGLGVVVLFGAALWLLSRRLTTPLLRLTQSAEAVAAGDHSRRVELRRQDELGRLADAFDTMAASVERRVEDLSASEARFRSLVTASAQIVWNTDSEGQVEGPLPSWQAYTGQSEEAVQGAGWISAVHPEDVPTVLSTWDEAVQRVEPYSQEYRIRDREGEYRWFAVRGVPVLDDGGEVTEWVGTCRDLTEARRTEELLHRKEQELHRSRRMEAIGRLTAGIAHDFNNLLTAILGPLELASGELADDDPVQRELDDARSAALRAADLTRQLLASGGQQQGTPTPLDLGDVAASVVQLLERVLGEDVELELSVQDGLRPIVADRSQIEQIIMNLAVNSRDAMPGGGQLTLEIRNIDLGPEFLERHAGASPGAHVLLSVSDTGVGMDRETRDRLFEPFFSTRRDDGGTGLGLSTVHGIVERSGGHISVYSEPGEGTTLNVYFRAGSDAASEETPSATAGDPGDLYGDETVLVVDDDRAVREMVERSLRRAGYEVMAAADGEDAMEVALKEDAKVDLLVTDLIMPGGSGPELLERMREELPGLRVLFLSGYARDAAVRRGMVEPEQFLQKPFAVTDLLTRVRAVLDEEETG